LAGGERQREGFAALLTRQLDLGGETALGPAQPVISRFRAGRLHLPIGVVAGARGVLMAG
jgi:hypothetical protein